MDDAGGQIGRLGKAGGQDHAVKENHQQGEQHAGRHRHEHVVAGSAQAAPAEATLQQGEGVLPVHLVEALRPPQPLIPGLPEGGGLLVVDHRLVAVADLLALDGAVHGELDILGEQVEGPAAVILNDPGGYQEAGARHMAVGAQQGAGEVEEPGLPQEPDGVAGGDPVGREVLGVAVAGHRIVAPVKGAVHLGDKIGVHQIVRVKDEVAVIAVLPLLFEAAEEVVHGVALALMYLVEALVHERAGPAGRPGVLRPAGGNPLHLGRAVVHALGEGHRPTHRRGPGHLRHDHLYARPVQPHRRAGGQISRSLDQNQHNPPRSSSR